MNVNVSSVNVKCQCQWHYCLLIDTILEFRVNKCSKFVVIFGNIFIKGSI